MTKKKEIPIVVKKPVPKCEFVNCTELTAWDVWDRYNFNPQRTIHICDRHYLKYKPDILANNYSFDYRWLERT